MFLSAKTPLVAIDIGSHSVKVAQLAGTPGKYELMSFGMMPLENEAVVDGVIKKEDVVIDALGALLKAEKIQTKYAVASVSGEAVIVKKIRVPQMSHADLAVNINHEAEQYIPFDIDDVSIDFQILGRGARVEPGIEEEENGQDKTDKMEILLVAVQKETIDNRIGVLSDAGLRPVIIDLDVFALVNALSNSRDLTQMGTAALIDLGASFTHLNIIQDGLTAFTRDIPMGGLACSQKLMSQFGVTYQEADALKHGEIPATLDREAVIKTIAESFMKIAEEIEKSFEFFSATSNSIISQVFLSGGGVLVPGACGLFRDKLGIMVDSMNPLDGIKVNPRSFDHDLVSRINPIAAVAIGLATRKFNY